MFKHCIIILKSEAFGLRPTSFSILDLGLFVLVFLSTLHANRYDFILDLGFNMAEEAESNRHLGLGLFLSLFGFKGDGTCTLSLPAASGMTGSSHHSVRSWTVSTVI